MGLRDLNAAKLRELVDSPTSLRKYCIENRLNFIDAFAEAEEILKQKPVQEYRLRLVTPKPKETKVVIERKKPLQREAQKRKKEEQPQRKEEIKRELKTPEEVVYRVLQEFRAEKFLRNVGTIEEIATRVSSDLTNLNITTSMNCPLESYVADVIYDRALELKYGKKRGELHRGHLTSEDFRRRFFVTFGEEAVNHIIGKISPEYIKSHYIFVDREMKYRGSNGEIVTSPNVEGAKCWDNGHKRDVRKKLVDFVARNLVEKRKEKERIFDARIEELEREYVILKERENEKKGELEECREESAITHIIKAEPYMVDVFRKEVLGGRAVKKRRKVNEEGEVIDGKHFRRITVEFDSSSPGRQQLTQFEENFTSFKAIHQQHIRDGRIEANILNVETIFRSRRENAAELERKIDEINKRKRQIENTKEDFDREKKRLHTISYLGLEGPAFGSFLALSEGMTALGYNAKGYFVENDFRLSNLMRSIIQSGLCEKVFDRSNLAYRDIDNLMLLDFVTNREVRVVQHNEILEDNNSKLHVQYKTERIEIPRYYKVLDEIDQHVPLDKISRDNKISEDFVSVISERDKRKFDVVFLDYIGRMTKTRSKAMESLIKRRLKDNAVIAATINTDFRVNPRRIYGPAKLIANALFDDFSDIVENAGYRITDMGQVKYNEAEQKKDTMCFQVYSLEKRRI